MKLGTYACDVCGKTISTSTTAVISITKSGYDMRNASPGRIEYEYHVCDSDCIKPIMKILLTQNNDEHNHYKKN